MPLRKHLPCSEKVLKNKNPEFSICETLRHAYKAIEKNNNEQAKEYIRIAISMAKSMAYKLYEYNSDWKKDFYDKTSDLD